MEYNPLNRTIYRKLCSVIPNLPEHLKAGTEYGKSALNKTGLMDLSYDYILEEKPGEHLIALGHRYEQNGDLVPDPDMEIRVIPIKEIAEALSFNNAFLYQHVENEGKKNEKLQH